MLYGDVSHSVAEADAGGGDDDDLDLVKSPRPSCDVGLLRPQSLIQ